MNATAHHIVRASEASASCAVLCAQLPRSSASSSAEPSNESASGDHSGARSESFFADRRVKEQGILSTGLSMSMGSNEGLGEHRG